MLIGCFVFTCYKFLTELVHEVCCHADDLRLIKVILDPLKVVIVILINIPLQILILPLQHHVHVGIHRFHALILLSQLFVLRKLVALFDFGLLP